VSPAERIATVLGSLNEQLTTATDIAADLEDATLDRALYATRSAIAAAGARALRLADSAGQGREARQGRSRPAEVIELRRAR
jgi:hypothetical protein